MEMGDVFSITGRGTVAIGHVLTGEIYKGEKVYFFKNNLYKAMAVITGIEMLRKLIPRAEFGDNIGLLVNVSKETISGCDLILSEKSIVFDKSGEVDSTQTLYKYAEEIAGFVELEKYAQKALEIPVETVKEGVGYNNSEQEYLDEYKAMLEDGEIGNRERRTLERLRIKLGISEEIAAELEKAAEEPYLTNEEQEYFDEYKAMLADGVIGNRERRTLERLRIKLGISEERADELEDMA